MSEEMGNLQDLLTDDGPGFSLADPKLIEAGEGLVNTIWNAGAEAWGVMLNRGLMYTSGSADFNDPSTIILSDIGECLITEIEWSGDRNGKVTFVLPILCGKAVVAYWMALMAGGDPDPDSTAMDEEGMDAFTEGVSQFLGQASQALRADPGGNVNLTATTTRVVDFVASAPAVELGNEFTLVADGQLTIEGMNPITVYTLMEPSVTGIELEVRENPSASDTVEAVSAEVSGDTEKENLKRLLKIRVPVHVNLATCKMRLSGIMDLQPGSIVEFRKSSEEPLDLCVRDVVIATGEAVIVEEHFGLQIGQLIDIRKGLAQ